MHELADKVVLVTGAGSGIGQAIAELFAREDACVVVTDMDAAKGEAVVASLRQEDLQAEFVALDIADEAQVKTAIEHCVGRYGRLDGLVANAGLRAANVPTIDLEFEDWRRVIDINLHGTFFCLK